MPVTASDARIIGRADRLDRPGATCRQIRCPQGPGVESFGMTPDNSGRGGKTIPETSAGQAVRRHRTALLVRLFSMGVGGSRVAAHGATDDCRSADHSGSPSVPEPSAKRKACRSLLRVGRTGPGVAVMPRRRTVAQGRVWRGESLIINLPAAIESSVPAVDCLRSRRRHGAGCSVRLSARVVVRGANQSKPIADVSARTTAC